MNTLRLILVALLAGTALVLFEAVLLTVRGVLAVHDWWRAR